VPTLLDIVGLPAKPVDANGPSEFAGDSLKNAISIDDVSNTQDILWWMHEENAALRMGDYKIVKAANEAWQLYDLSKDRIESHDLSIEQPDRLSSMIGKWETLRNDYEHDASR
jgi:arylsulfatase A-like enzyme